MSEKTEPEEAGDALAEAIQREDSSAPIVTSGRQTANIAARMLVEKNIGFVLPTGTERQNLLVAFAKTGGVVYGRAFDLVRLSAAVNLDDETDVARNLREITLYEVDLPPVFVPRRMRVG